MSMPSFEVGLRGTADVGPMRLLCKITVNLMYDQLWLKKEACTSKLARSLKSKLHLMGRLVTFVTWATPQGRNGSAGDGTCQA